MMMMTMMMMMMMMMMVNVNQKLNMKKRLPWSYLPACHGHAFPPTPSEDCALQQI
jgi:hypothetical protein